MIFKHCEVISKVEEKRFELYSLFIHFMMHEVQRSNCVIMNEKANLIKYRRTLDRQKSKNPKIKFMFATLFPPTKKKMVEK